MGWKQSKADDRLRQELTALQQAYTVRYDATGRTVVVGGAQLSDGWTPPVITVRIRLPPQFPRAAPGWVFPGELRWAGRIPRSLFTSQQWIVRGVPGDPFLYWPVDWDSPQSTLREETERVLADLAAVSDPGAVEGDDV
jgi:hypothetical protein